MTGIRHYIRLVLRPFPTRRPLVFFECRRLVPLDFFWGFPPICDDPYLDASNAKLPGPDEPNTLKSLDNKLLLSELYDATPDIIYCRAI
jgi:hypothetical protein